MSGRVGLSLEIGLIAAAFHTWSIDQDASVVDDVQDHTESALQRAAVDHGNTTNLDEVLGLRWFFGRFGVWRRSTRRTDLEERKISRVCSKPSGRWPNEAKS